MSDTGLKEEDQELESHKNQGLVKLSKAYGCWSTQPNGSHFLVTLLFPKLPSPAAEEIIKPQAWGGGGNSIIKTQQQF